jgi:hypothetical protein
MRLSFFFLVRILIRVLSSRLLPAFIGSDLLATTGRSAISQPIGSTFPSRLYLSYLVRVYVKETTRLPSVIYTFCSIHPDPNHVDEPCRSYPFICFPARYAYSHKFPRFHGGSPYIAATSGSPHSGLDFACRPFGFPLTRDTLPILLLLE